MKKKFSLNKQRNKYQNSNLQNIDDVEDLYLETSSLESKSQSDYTALRREYKHLCTKSDVLTKVREFYVDKWFETTSKMINEIDSMKMLKEMKTELYKFKEVLSIREEIQDDVEMNIENLVRQCIVKRITYKHTCIENPDRNHDAEILRQVFYHERLKELKELFIKIKQRYISVKELQMQNRRKEEEKRRQEDIEELEFLKLSTESSSGTFQQIVPKREKRRSRKRR